MKDKLLIWVWAAAGLALATACSDTFDPSVDRAGRILPSVGLDREVAAPQSKAAARADGQAMQISPDDLKLTLTADDGSLQRVWESISAFDSTEDFPVGSYTMEASYGDQDFGGFNRPYYYGVARFSVLENQVSPVNLTASLGNAMLTITFSDAMGEYFNDFSGEVRAGTSQYTYNASETRSLYMVPGHVEVNVNITKPNGLTGKINVKSFEAEARHHYKMFIDVNNGEVGSSGLSVTFNSDLVEEEVVLDVSDQVLAADAPVISPIGFSPGSPIEVIEGLQREEIVQMSIMAQGYVNTAVLTTSASLVERGWPASVDFATADATMLTKLHDLNMGFVGLDGIKSQMAFVGFNRIPEKLEYIEGGNNEVSFTLVAKDNNAKVSAPLTLTYIIKPMVLSIENVAPLGVDATELTFDFVYNGPIGNVNFERKNEQGIFRSIKTLSIERSQDDPERYRVTVEVPADEKNVVIRANSYGTHYSEAYTIVRTGAAISISDNDVFATYASLQFRCGANDPAHAVNSSVMLSTNGTDFTEHTSKTVSGRVITITGLAPDTKYFAKIHAHEGMSNIVEFTTEDDISLPNGDMENWHRTEGLTQWWWVSYPYGKNDEPYWATLNQLTTSEGGTHTSWTNRDGCAYSAISGTIETTDKHGGTYAALIRTVGWGSGNSAAAISGNMGTCQHVTAGELYLGSYSSDPIYGRAFTSRPKSITFWYKYSPKNSADQASAQIAVYDASGTVIANKEVLIDAQGTYTRMTMVLDYPAGCGKAASLDVRFKSSINDVNSQKNTNWLTPPPARNTSDGTYMGSQLFIDDIVLNY